ncbi:MAG: hypothetical protein DLM68_02145 [Hyphomicrobiales bacterium]|nr:MAG: hypothetical protein DLM68_02145 [Hyphomicrobiales bacterium]
MPERVAARLQASACFDDHFERAHRLANNYLAPTRIWREQQFGAQERIVRTTQKNQQNQDVQNRLS